MNTVIFEKSEKTKAKTRVKKLKIVINSCTDKVAKKALINRLREVQRRILLEELNKGLEVYKNKFSELPPSLSAIFERGVLSGEVQEGELKRYRINRELEKVELIKNSD